MILITGTSRGIGLELVRHYSNLGHMVYGCSRSPFPDKDIATYRHFTLDITDEPAVLEMFREIRKEDEPLCVLINNAGIASMNSVLMTPMKSAHNIMNVNFFGSLLTCREAGKLMAQNWYGRIINFSTVAYPMALQGEAVYAASKAALEALTKVYARELGDRGVTVNAVGPNPIPTDLIKGVSEARIQHIINRQAIARKGTVADVVNVIDFFMRPESNLITGQVIYLGGF